MVSLTGMPAWGGGRFGLTLEAGVGLWCAIGSSALGDAGINALTLS
ncbi:hypothetical protein [Nostoc sp. MG11]|nr:hypothetical protein [Nostoc sp. MG11]